MTSMWTGVSGLKVNQSALNTTGHNLANVDTKGYVRQQVLTTDFSYNTIGQSYMSSMQIGLGTDMAAIRQVRDVFLDKSYRLEIGRQGFYETQFEAVSEVEGLFGELEGETFQEQLSGFWASLQELAKEPDSIVKKSSFIETTISFLERADNISKQLADYQINLNTQISQKVNRINSIGDQIKELNTKIRKYESGDEAANDYRDARNVLLDELGDLAKFTYSEDSTGVVTVNLEGTQFVTEANVYHLTTKTVSATSTMLKPVWETSGNDLYILNAAYSTKDNTDVGSLKGLLVARGDYAAKYTDIPLKENYASTAAYEADVKKYNNTVNSSVLMAVQAQFDQLIHGIVTTINDILSPNTSVSDYATNMKIPGTVDDITYSVTDASGNITTTSIVGTTQTVTVEDSLGNPIGVPVVTTIKPVLLWDKKNAPIGNDTDKSERQELFERKSTERYTKASMTVTDGATTNTYDVYIYNQEEPTNNYSLYTLGEIKINDKIKNNYSMLPLSANNLSGKAGAYDIATCDKLLNAWKTDFATLDPNTLTKNNFDEYYTAFIGGIANKGDVFDTIATNQKSMVESIDGQRQQVAGVSSDEELTNLIKFQHGYNAAARYISVIDQMLEHVVTRL